MTISDYLYLIRDRINQKDDLDNVPESSKERIVLVPGEDGKLRASNFVLGGEVVPDLPASASEQDRKLYILRAKNARDDIEVRGARVLRWVESWPNLADKWPFTLGMPAKFVACTMSCVYISQHYKRYFKTGKHGRIMIFLLAGAAPGVMNTLFHRQFVTTPMLGSVTSASVCPICLETRALMIQLGHGLVMPAISSMAVVLFLAGQYITAPMPSLVPWSVKNTLFVAKWIANTVKPALVGRVAMAAFAFNVAFILIWTHFEFYSLHRIAMKMRTHREVVSQLGEKQVKYKSYAEPDGNLVHDPDPKPADRFAAYGDPGLEPGVDPRVTLGLMPSSEARPGEAMRQKPAVSMQLSDAVVLSSSSSKQQTADSGGWLSFFSRAASAVTQPSSTSASHTSGST